ncbi:hypothetical protein AVEN_165734-1 [Araneus ventricosus]|uniref:Uncharacterized protein n=1 Tax=Araneus ventricosus TaxID=182803 RepID=A0A4Y2C566_ARAVE|nr:hypothetical protein AVEN_165734-1 [Araneus ventricosus]
MSEVNGLKNICLFLVTVYVKSWLESSSAIGAPLNDLMFLKKLKKYENMNQGISSIALKKSCCLWYLNEESSIFDKNVNIASKKRIIENLKRENLHIERKCIVQPNEVPLLLGEELSPVVGSKYPKENLVFYFIEDKKMMLNSTEFFSDLCMAMIKALFDAET